MAGKKHKHREKRAKHQAESSAAVAVADAAPVRESVSTMVGPLAVVDRNEWRYDSWGADTGGFVGAYIDDPRDDGRNRPFIETEHDLRDMQAVARVLVEVNPYARGLLESLTNFVIGTGFKYLAATKKKRQAPAGLVDAIQDTIDVFLDANDWQGDYEREMFCRSRRDGEYFLRLHPDRDCVAKIRAIEPEYIREPVNARQIEEYGALRYPYACDWSGPFSWRFGIQTPEEDTVESLGYLIDWQPGSADFEYVPAYEVEHVKCNVDRNIKRGMSDFFPSRKWLDKALKLLGGTVSGATVQSKIAVISNMEPGVSGDKVQSAQSGAADFQARKPTQSGGTKTTDVQRLDEGTILRAPQGRTYMPGPMGQSGAPVYIEVLQAALRAIAARWSMPEYMISSDASNNNYASILEAGSPFRKAIESSQAFYKRRFGRIVWKALRIAYNMGRFTKWGVTWGELERLVEVQIEAPIVEVTDRTAETARREVLARNGLLSKQTWAAQEELDYELEVANGAKAESGTDLSLGAPSSGVGSGDSLDASVAANADQDIQVSADLVLNGAQITAATGIVVQVAAGEIPRDAGLGQLKILFNLADEQALQIMGSAGTTTPTTPNPRPGMDTETGATTNAPAGDGSADAASVASQPAAYKDASRLQFKRNKASIRQVVNELIAGESTEAEARVLLRSLGLSDTDADQLVTSAADGKVDDEEVIAASESLVRDTRQSIIQEAARQLWETYP